MLSVETQNLLPRTDAQSKFRFTESGDNDVSTRKQLVDDIRTVE